MTNLQIAIEALTKIAKSNRDEGGCYYTNRGNILTANEALKDIKENNNKVISINVDSLEVFAKLNYYRDKSLGLVPEDWEDIKEEYILEAENDPDIVLTMEELDTIVHKGNRR